MLNAGSSGRSLYPADVCCAAISSGHLLFLATDLVHVAVEWGPIQDGASARSLIQDVVEAKSATGWGAVDGV